MNPALAPTLIPLADAAFRIRVPYATAHRLLMRGELQGERRGRSWLVDESSIERYRPTEHPSGRAS